MAFAVCGLLCMPLAEAATTPTHDTDSANRSKMIQRLEEITENVNFLEAEFFPQEVLELVPLTVEGRLRFMEKDVPMTFNEQVRSYIETYTSPRYKNHVGRMLGLSTYYFPIFERIFDETGVPDEIKYLSIVESALNPHAVSRVGATGHWQFMYATARMYDLEMSSYADERRDPVAATYAASAYLLDAYDRFGDWLLAIASYNCGAGNVIRAIRRSGIENPDYWQISPHLPRETRNYVPAFIAMAYVFAFHEEHGIEPIQSDLHIDTEEVAVNKMVSLKGIADALELDLASLKTLNPAYKRDVVNGSADRPKRIVLPNVEPAYYPTLYAVLNHGPSAAPAVMNASLATEEGNVLMETHRVKRGESLGTIARRHGVTVQDLRAWNNIKGNTIIAGQNLRLAKKSGEKPAASAAYVTYKVKRGDTLSTIAKRYPGASVSKIKTDNNLANNGIKAGMTLKISTM